MFNSTTILYFLGLFVATASIIYTQYKMGSNKVSSQVLSNYQILDKQQKEIIADKEEKIVKYQLDLKNIQLTLSSIKEEFAKEIGKLQGQIDAKDKELASLRATILDPSINLGKVLGEIKDFMEKIHNANIYQTDILEGQLVREQKIDQKNK